MGLCDKTNERNSKTLLIAACTGVPTFAFVLINEGNPVDAVMGGAVVAAICAGGYYFYKCDFNLVGCGFQGVSSVGCGAVTEVKSFLGIDWGIF